MSHDSAIDRPDEDVLERVQFVGEVANIAAKAPAEWAVRIGVYGQWGEGKSSVINMVSRRLREEGHVVAAFNPWGCESSEAMAKLLAEEVLRAAEQVNIKVKGGVGRRVRQVAKGAAKFAELGVDDAATAIGSATGNEELGTLLSPAFRFATAKLSQWAGGKAASISDVVESMPTGKRLVVCVDDIDRVDPKLLPQLLFAIHEVLSLPGFSFIMALDPAVVAAALAEYHPGFGNGFEYLNKIVQFPRWLPEPDEAALFRLAERDRTRYAPFLRAEVFQDLADVLPKNPRRLRSLVRNMWRLGDEVLRHDADEIDQHLLVLLEAIRQQSAPFLERLLARLATGTVPEVESTAGQARFEEELRPSMRDSSEDERSRLLRLSARLIDHVKWRNISVVQYHARLGDRPHAVTWKEFRTLESTQPERRAEWLAQHCRDRTLPPSAVLLDCVGTCLLAYSRELDEAAMTESAEVHKKKIARCARLVDLLEYLWFADERATNDAGFFSRFIGVARSFSRFVRNEGESGLRQSEMVLGLKVSRSAKFPADFLDAIESWDHSFERRDPVSLAVVAELEARAADGLLSLFQQPGGVAGCLRGSKLAVKAILGRKSPMWNEVRLEALQKLVTTGGDVLAENCRDFVETLVPSGGGPYEAEVAHDQALLRLLWAGATATPVQFRFFSRMCALRTRLESVCPQLAVPGWWAALEQRRVEAAPES